MPDNPKEKGTEKDKFDVEQLGDQLEDVSGGSCSACNSCSGCSGTGCAGCGAVPVQPPIA
jgi:hypothetical protein